MSKFIVSKSNISTKMWKVDGFNPKTMRNITMYVGEDEDKTISDDSMQRIKSYSARNGVPKTPVSFLKMKIWYKELKDGTHIEIPDYLF